jgi:ABC-type multidrug transport system fused ATPase/permease subunit
VGRTGAGKSSLALALFRGLEAVHGKIVIDGIDISTIGLQDLRENITIVPQDPTLFTGTIRSNLDPFGLFSDEQIFVALRRVHLITETASGTATPASPAVVNQSVDDVSAAPENKNIFRNLESPVAESGSNLSQGQRQLLCLARALLKSPRVLMMDEATASIDYATDAKIQETLRELKESTIITIAHRLQTIIDYDKVLVLDHGRVVEFDHPWTLINKEDGSFRGMCENSGNMEALLDGAKGAWESKRLVETD